MSPRRLVYGKYIQNRLLPLQCIYNSLPNAGFGKNRHNCICKMRTILERGDFLAPLLPRRSRREILHFAIVIEPSPKFLARVGDTFSAPRLHF